MYSVRIINKDGIFQKDEFVDELTEFTIEQPIKDMYAVLGVTPKWNGEEWVEVVEKPVKEPTIDIPTSEDRIEQLEDMVMSMMFDLMNEK